MRRWIFKHFQSTSPIQTCLNECRQSTLNFVLRHLVAILKNCIDIVVTKGIQACSLPLRSSTTFNLRDFKSANSPSCKACHGSSNIWAGNHYSLEVNLQFFHLPRNDWPRFLVRPRRSPHQEIQPKSLWGIETRQRKPFETFALRSKGQQTQAKAVFCALPRACNPQQILQAQISERPGVPAEG